MILDRESARLLLIAYNNIVLEHPSLGSCPYCKAWMSLSIEDGNKAKALFSEIETLLGGAANPKTHKLMLKVIRTSLR